MFFIAVFSMSNFCGFSFELSTLNKAFCELDEDKLDSKIMVLVTERLRAWFLFLAVFTLFIFLTEVFG